MPPKAPRLKKKELDELEALMDVRDPDLAGPMQGAVSAVHGLLTCVVSGPMVMPSEWLPIVFGGDEACEWQTMDQAKRALDLVMRLYNEIVDDLMPGGRRFGILIDRLGVGRTSVEFANDWAQGYAIGMELRKDEWEQAMKARKLKNALAPILILADVEKRREINPFDHPKKYDATVGRLPESAVEIWDWWRANGAPSTATATQRTSAQPKPSSSPGTFRRAGPKISANDPCPCGSGKKYKRCCSPLRAL